MRVEFREPMLSRIRAAVYAAECAGKSIERIVLSEDECRRLQRECFPFQRDDSKVLFVMGVRVEVEPDATHVAD